jgi:Lrp/AsnC family transcriptional regulator, leucine-responsive regulatory protein
LTLREDCAQKLQEVDGFRQQEAAVDALDRRILREVQRDCSGSAVELAERCGTTESTALRRLRKLRRDGVIRGEVALVEGTKVGRDLLIWVTVRLEREDGPSVRAFIDRVRGHRDVLQFHFVTGTPDYLILLCVPSMEDYDAFLQQHLVSDPLVVMSETNVVVRPLKMSTAIPIDERCAE